jgi:hypothetical protein
MEGASATQALVLHFDSLMLLRRPPLLVLLSLLLLLLLQPTRSFISGEGQGQPCTWWQHGK